MLARTIFITATDTGVGKTVLTSLLYRHLRSRGHRVVAMKPFCSGSRSDALLLHSLQPASAQSLKLTIDQINPFYFSEPVAPLVAARKRRRIISIDNVLNRIEQIRTEQVRVQSSEFKVQGSSSRPNPSYLLIEGAGGLLAPLGPRYLALDIIRRLECGCIVVSANRLGTLNHTLLTVRALQDAGIQRVTVALSDLCKPGVMGLIRTGRSSRIDLNRGPDASRGSNLAVLKEFLNAIEVLKIPYLGRNPEAIPALKRNAKKLQKTLARLVESCIFYPRSL